MRPIGFKVKPTTRTTAPTVLVTVGVSVTEASFRDSTGDRPWVHSYAYVCVRRRIKGKWGKVREYRTNTVAGFWDVLDRLGNKSSRPYVVCSRASDVLTLLRWWERVESGEVMVWPKKGEEWETDPRTGKRRKIRRHPIVMHGAPDIFGYTVRGCPFRWVSVSNWCALGLREMARSVGHPIPSSATDMDSWECPDWPAEDQARMVMSYMTKLCDWWMKVKGGTWKDTPGAAAWSTFLSQGGESGIIRHIEPGVLAIEDEACFGARVSLWWHGDIGLPGQWAAYPHAPFSSGRGRVLMGPVHRFDVRAMYPSLLRSERFPIRLMNHHGAMSARDLAVFAERFCVIARVLVESQRGELPRHGDRDTEFPVGQWWTTLTTPEVRDALRHGEVRAVRNVAVYQPGSPFLQWANWILGLRDAMRSNGDKPGELLVKVLANSLGGRLGRKRQGWKDSPGTIPQKWWGEWLDLDAENGAVVSFRSLARHVQRMDREQFRPGTLGACYAHLTAYGRSYMAGLRAKLSRTDVLWQHTDGLILTERGAEHIRELPEYHPTRYGAIRYEKSFTCGRFITPQHFWLDGQWVLSGIHDGFAVDDGMVSSELLSLNPTRSAIRPDNASITRIARHIRIGDIEPGVGIDGSGWATPPQREAGFDPRPQARNQTPPLPVNEE